MKRILPALVLVIAIAAPIAAIFGNWAMTSSTITGPLLGISPFGGGRSELSSLDRAGEWLNSAPLTAESLRGKTVLINFGTYTCINWLRTLPYIRAWANKYEDRGLVLISVHTPEFEFEKNLNNVRLAISEMRIEHPVIVDNDYGIWRAFANRYWPALYFIDTQGRVRHHHFGEGSYEQSEKILQDLLTEAGQSGIDREPVSVEGAGIEAAPDWSQIKSAENYLGYGRTESFDSPGGAATDRSRVYELPAKLRLNAWALSGDWTMKREAVALNAPNGSIVYRFHARDLHLVMGPAASGTSVRFRMLIDGQPPGADHGADVNPQGEGTVVQQRLYQLIRQKGPVAERQFEIEFLDSGVEAFAFTFG